MEVTNAEIGNSFNDNISDDLRSPSSSSSSLLNRKGLFGNSGGRLNKAMEISSMEVDGNLQKTNITELKKRLGNSAGGIPVVEKNINGVPAVENEYTKSGSSDDVSNVPNKTAQDPKEDTSFLEDDNDNEQKEPRSDVTEIFEKKILSMDTSLNDTEIDIPPQEKPELVSEDSEVVEENLNDVKEKGESPKTSNHMKDKQEVPERLDDMKEEQRILEFSDNMGEKKEVSEQLDDMKEEEQILGISNDVEKKEIPETSNEKEADATLHILEESDKDGLEDKEPNNTAVGSEELRSAEESSSTEEIVPSEPKESVNVADHREVESPTQEVVVAEQTSTPSTSEDQEKLDLQPEEVHPTQRTPRGKSRKSLSKGERVDLEEKSEQDSGEREDVPPPTKRRSVRQSQVQVDSLPVISKRKEKAPNTEEDQHVPPENSSGRRSLRARAPTEIPPTPEPKTKTPATKNRRSTKDQEEIVEEEKVEDEAKNDKNKTPESDQDLKKTPSRSKRVKTTEPAETPVSETKKTLSSEKSASKAKTPTTQARAKSTTKKKAEAEAEPDPYDIDTKIDEHPEPLKNIHMQVQSFGSVKYEKVGIGKYEQTEKAAESRIGNLVTPKATNRKSLAEMTPSRQASSHATSSAKRSRPQKLSEKEDVFADEPMDFEDTDTTKSEQNKTARKRKADTETTPVSAKKPHVEIPEFTSEQQWMIDHPEDEHAPHQKGARVYALFAKIYYPAIVVDDRDALGRFKVYFTADQIVKDVPTAGVIPLRAVVSEKTCFYEDNVAQVLACPNAASADEWTEGQFKIVVLDEDMEPNGETLSVNWKNISLDMNDWKEYIQKKSSEATQIITDNISSIDNRQRRSTAASAVAVATPTATKAQPKTPKSAKTTEKTPPSSSSQRKGRGSRSKRGTPPPKLESSLMAEEEIPPPTGAAVHLFEGKAFILTSANRPSPDGSLFRKKFMHEHIVMRMGTVVEDFKDFDDHPELEPFLISDTHYRTHKYLAAMARGMPCVSHKWVRQCLKEGVLVDYEEFLLPAGVSILDHKLYPLSREAGVLLKNKRVFVHSRHPLTGECKNMSFNEIWKPIVKFLGGELFEEEPESEYEVLLTDNSANPKVVENASKKKADIVSSEYIIQAIIMNKLPPVNGHVRFKPEGLTRSSKDTKKRH